MNSLSTQRFSAIDFLPKAVDASRSPSDEVKREVKVEMYNTQGKVEQIRAFTFNPYRTTWWNYIIYLINEYVFKRKMTVLVRVEGESSLLYMRVDEVSHVLGMSTHDFRKRIQSKNVTNELIQNNITRVVESIQKMVTDDSDHGIIYNPRKAEMLRNIMAHIPYRNIHQILNFEEFDTIKLARTLFAIGNRINLSSTSFISEMCIDSGYIFEINPTTVKISFVNNQQQKVSLDLKTLSISKSPITSIPFTAIQKLRQSFRSKTASIRQQFRSFPPAKTEAVLVLEELQRLADTYKIVRISTNQFQTLTKRVSPGNLLCIVEFVRHLIKSVPFYVLDALSSNTFTISSKDQLDELMSKTKTLEEENIFRFVLKFTPIQSLLPLSQERREALVVQTLQIAMLKTFIKIATILMTPEQLVDNHFYQPRLKSSNGVSETYAFAISADGKIFIIQFLLDKGSYKRVSVAIEATNLEEDYVRLKIHRTTSKLDVIEKTKAEKELLAELHKKNPYLMAPYENQIILDNNGQLMTSRAARVNMNRNKPVEKEVKQSNKRLSKNKSAPKQAKIIPKLIEEDKLILFQLRYMTAIELLGCPVFHVLNAFKEIALGLALLHEQNYIHSDVKPQNIFLYGDLESSVPIKARLGDIGLVVEQGNHIQGGTPHFFAPEAISNVGNKIAARVCIARPPVDSFPLGISLLFIFDEYEILHLEKGVYLGLMEQKEIDHLIDQFESAIKRDSSLNDKDRIMKLEMIKVCRGLLIVDWQRRLSCADAAAQFTSIQNRLYPQQNAV